MEGKPQIDVLTAAAPFGDAEVVTEILDHCPIGVAVVGADMRVYYGNARFRDIATADGATVGLHRSWPALDTFLVEPAERSIVRAALARGERLPRRELEWATQEGHSVWVLMSAEPTRFEGAPAVLVWLDDVTRRRLTIDALRASEERLDLAVTGTRSAIWEVDFTRRTTWWSQEFYRMLGYSDDERTGADENVWERHIHPEDAARVIRGIRQYLKSDRPVPEAGADVGVYEATYRLCRLDGGIIWVVAKGRRSSNEGGRRRFNGIMFDVTAQKRAEQALRQAQQDLIQAEKMAALGSLVAGVAHEINTPLGNTLTASSHLYDKVAEFSTLLEENRLKKSDLVGFVGLLTETTRLMVANCERAAELVQSFKQVAVDQTSGERRRFDLKGYIEEVLLSLRPRLRKTGHRITVECPPHIEVDGYPGALSQLLTNFLLNSLMHAYGPGDVGNIRITVCRIDAATIELAYADDGRGIPAALVGRIYDPFFTTRRGSGGSGLGLHIVYNLVTGTLRGQIAVHSEPGRGTQFTVRFPLHVPAEPGKTPDADD
ncbi:MAG TPA: ATP-binding protein [Acetobacteraceae bacterium]|jgi:PAS domain S-box-containing protein|nr:ATP-binding protein [Acetobacteraceae bacterium]